MAESSAASRKYFSYRPVLAYLFVIFYITILSRTSYLMFSCNTQVFHSFRMWRLGSMRIGEQIVLNVIMFVPYGYFLSNNDRLTGWRALLIPLAMSLFTSMSVEALQYLLGLGQCDIDDLICNTLGAAIGLCFFWVLRRILPERQFAAWRKAVTVLLLLAGMAGCIRVYGSSAQDFAIKQFDFSVLRVTRENGRLCMEGICHLYDRSTPSYALLLKGERSGKEYPTELTRSGDTYCASAQCAAEEKLEIFIKFFCHKPISTLTYLDGDGVEYVRGEVTPPTVQETELTEITTEGLLKAYDPLNETYVYQYQNRLYWLIGGSLEDRTEIICHLSTNEPEKLPEKRKPYLFDNIGFRPGGKNELTENMRCGTYRVFVREIPTEYPVTMVSVGFNTGGECTWRAVFKLTDGDTREKFCQSAAAGERSKEKSD